MKKKGGAKNKDEFKMTWKEWLIILFIAIALIALFITGGNNQSWWPGKPYHLR